MRHTISAIYLVFFFSLFPLYNNFFYRVYYKLCTDLDEITVDFTSDEHTEYSGFEFTLEAIGQS